MRVEGQGLVEFMAHVALSHPGVAQLWPSPLVNERSHRRMDGWMEKWRVLNFKRPPALSLHDPVAAERSRFSVCLMRLGRLKSLARFFHTTLPHTLPPSPATSFASRILTVKTGG